MDRKTAMSAAGAFTLTAAAAVSALFVTIDRGAEASEPTAPAVAAAEPEVITEYEVIQLEAPTPEAVEPVAAPAAESRTVYEVQYVQAAAEPAEVEYGDAEYESDDDESDEYEDDEYESDEYEDGDDDHEDEDGEVHYGGDESGGEDADVDGVEADHEADDVDEDDEDLEEDDEDDD